MDTKNHALAILQTDFPTPLEEICLALLEIEIPCYELIQGGGGRAPITTRLGQSFSKWGWLPRRVVVQKTINGRESNVTSHEIDHFREDINGDLALEIEWNNKDPFFDRDLENFQRLHAEGAISVGIIVTRGSSFQEQMTSMVSACAEAQGILGFDDLRSLGVSPTSRQRNIVEKQLNTDFLEAWPKSFVADKFGQSTTHWSQLQRRIH